MSDGQRGKAFGYFLRALRQNAKNGVLFTMCQDLMSQFEGDKLVLTTESEVIYRSLNREEHYKSIRAAMEKVGVQDFEIRLKGKEKDGADAVIESLKKNFPSTEMEIK